MKPLHACEDKRIDTCSDDDPRARRMRMRAARVVSVPLDRLSVSHSKCSGWLRYQRHGALAALAVVESEANASMYDGARSNANASMYDGARSNLVDVMTRCFVCITAHVSDDAAFEAVGQDCKASHRGDRGILPMAVPLG